MSTLFFLSLFGAKPWVQSLVELLTDEWYLVVLALFILPFIIGLVFIPVFYIISVYLWNTVTDVIWGIRPFGK